MKKVLVLLSTYNGEKYIETQVNSVLKQKKVDVDIFIRDDGSKDGTVAVIEKLNDSRISIFKEENKGATNSFFKDRKLRCSMIIMLFAIRMIIGRRISFMQQR